jgi:hypothetical protein
MPAAAPGGAGYLLKMPYIAIVTGQNRAKLILIRHNLWEIGAEDLVSVDLRLDERNGQR